MNIQIGLDWIWSAKLHPCPTLHWMYSLSLPLIVSIFADVEARFAG